MLHYHINYNFGETKSINIDLNRPIIDHFYEPVNDD